MEKIALYPGTFDPLTYGHLDLIERSLRIFDILIVGVAKNPAKKPLFSVEERVGMIEHAMADRNRVRVVSFDCLLVDFAEKMEAKAIIRGLRAVSDFEKELQMALINRKLSTDIETVFMMPNEIFGYLSSQIVKEVASFGGNISEFVTPYIREKLLNKLKDKR